MMAQQEQHNQQQVAELGANVEPEYPAVNWQKFAPEKRELATKLLTDYQKEVLGATWPLIRSCQFPQVEPLWTKFWVELPGDQAALLSEEEVCDAIALSDFILAENANKIMIPDALMPVEAKLASGVRDFAKNLPRWTQQTVEGKPEPFVRTRTEGIDLWASCMRGQTSLNHVGQAARAVLRSPKNTEQMANDWGRLDLNDVARQTEWTCPEAVGLMKQMHTGFEQCLRSKGSLEDYVAWARGLVTEGVSQDVPGTPADQLAEMVLRWSFIMSLIIRDLTLRSAPGFGNFHLFSLLFNEYLLYMVDVAKHEEYGKQLRARLQPALTTGAA